MPILNENENFINLGPDVRNAFIVDQYVQVEKILLRQGCKLYKFNTAGRGIERQDLTITPWWSSTNQIGDFDNGLETVVKTVKTLKLDPGEYARVTVAVTNEWSDMDVITHITLNASVYAFFGQCANQPQHTAAPVAAAHVKKFPGRAFQLYIPNLTRAFIDGEYETKTDLT